MADMVSELAAIPLLVQERAEPFRYGDQPGIDQAHLRQLARTLRDMDADVLAYDAEGRAEEYLRDFDLNRCLESTRCPVLLVQADPAMGGLMTDRSVENALARLDRGYHVLIKEADHGLELDWWEVSPLLGTVTAFLELI
jgi:pimeloyl-ACP methyl ester carboxylesterase